MTELNEERLGGAGDVGEKCVVCGSSHWVTEYRSVPYLAAPWVTLLNVPVHRCTACGEEEVEIPRQRELSDLIARDVALHPARSDGQRIRFLRKYLGWSNRDFARWMGVTETTTSKWQHDDRQMGVTAELLLRAFIGLLPRVDDYREHDETPRLIETQQRLSLQLEMTQQWGLIVDGVSSEGTAIRPQQGFCVREKRWVDSPSIEARC